MNQLKKQILHITPRYFPSRGGVETHLSEVNKLLIQKGYEVSVITLQHDTALPLEENRAGVKIIRIPKNFSDSKLQVWWWFLKNSNLLNNTALFIHDVGWQVLPLMPQLYKKFCLIFHGWEGIYPIPLKNILQRRFFALCAQQTVHIGAFIETFYGDHPDVVVYGGIRSSLLQDTSLHRGNTSSLHFVFVGRLEKVNEIEKYLQFFRLLQQEKLHFSVEWLGDGSYRKQCASIGLVRGMVPDIERYVAKAAIVCANSYLSILEAQALGKVVLSFYSNSVKKAYLETFPGAHCLVMSASSTEMKNKLSELLTHPTSLIQLQKESQQFAREYTWEKISAVYEKIANRLCC